MVATNGARTCVPGPLAGAGAPRAGNTLITLEVTGLRGGLKRNWLLFTDTIWTQPTSSPFSAKSPTRGAGVGVTPDPARSVPSPVLVWPVPRIPSSQRQRGEYCLRQGILTSPQCQPSAEPGNASLEPQGPCAACPAPREGDAGAEPAGTRWVQASLEPAVWEQPSLRLSCRPRHRHAGPGTGGTAVPVGLSFPVPQGWLTGDSRPRPRCWRPSPRPDLPGGRRHRSDPQPEGDTGTSSPRFQNTTPRGTSSTLKLDRALISPTVRTAGILQTSPPAPSSRCPGRNLHVPAHLRERGQSCAGVGVRGSGTFQPAELLLSPLSLK